MNPAYEEFYEPKRMCKYHFLVKKWHPTKKVWCIY